MKRGDVVQMKAKDRHMFGPPYLAVVLRVGPHSIGRGLSKYSVLIRRVGRRNHEVWHKSFWRVTRGSKKLRNKP